MTTRTLPATDLEARIWARMHHVHYLMRLALARNDFPPLKRLADAYGLLMCARERADGRCPHCHVPEARCRCRWSLVVD